MTKETLPLIDPVTATRFAAHKIGEYTLTQQKGHQEVNFTRPTARAEQMLVERLSLSKLGEAALVHFAQEDTTFHLENQP